MRRFTDAAALLHSLLDRAERQPNRTRRVTVRPAQSFDDGRQRDDLAAALRAAEDAGAIDIEWDRDAPHLIGKVALRDPDRLYRHVRRTPSAQSAAAAAGRITAIATVSPEAAELASAFADAWRGGVLYLGLGPSGLDDAAWLVRCMDAAVAPGTWPLRTRSTRLLNDSKALERALPRLLTFLRRTGRVDPALSDDEAAARLGLQKFPWPILVAGPLCFGATDVTAWPYAGVPPDMIAEIVTTAAPRALLTIENLESFHRHVREARQPDDIVVYTGGFPSGSVVEALRRLVVLAGTGSIFHWGDIDPGGVRIGAFLESVLPCAVHPHLMSQDLAIAHGKPVSAARPLALPTGSAFSPLATFLASADAHLLEQEGIDPRPIAQP